MVNLKIMKTKINSLVFVLLIISLSGCEIDNYGEPELILSGEIVDSQTGELVESGGINSGSLIRLYEDDSNQPIILNTLPDGTFTYSKIFAGNYSYTVEGPFESALDGSQNLVIGNDIEIEIPVVPNVRLNATLEQIDGSTARINLEYEKVHSEQELLELGVVWSDYPNPNVYVFPEGGIELEDVDPSQSSGVISFIISGLNPNTTYYFRGAAVTDNPGNHYNYTSQIELQN